MSVDDVKDILKIVMPLALAYVGVLRNRTDIDRLAPKIRGGGMRDRWYHKLKPMHRDETHQGEEDA